MRVYLTSIPEDWICESCQSTNDTASPSKVNQDCGRQASKRRRGITTGKVKFIPEDEVIKLSSGNLPVKHRPGTSTFLTQKTSVGSKNVISKTPSMALKSNYSKSKLPRIGVHRNSATDKHAHLSQSKGPVKEYRLENQQLLITPMPGGILCAVSECNKSIEKSDLQSIQENFNLHRKFLPSSIATWRGQFQIGEAAASSKVYDGFKAQPPCTVNSKAYKFSTTMPSLLQLKSLPTLNVLTDVFQNDCPTLQDIALYFFPLDHIERYRENFNSIFEFMNAEKLMLSSVIDGVELMVFTSNELHVISRGTIATVNEDKKDFLWGVFRRIKIHKGNEIQPVKEPVETDADMIRGKEVNIDRSADMDAVDMDIDMIGGKDVAGRIDHVKKDLFQRSSTTLLQESGCSSRL
ncbi:hypothetical protein TanjilG_12280 [Lupinus angustifolius]|uniref:AIPP2-like SPOC-like domain-containing protein n=1 Tax=Lupinus angustifolius TaxID=3871 RepID=A0A1J7IA25_LUPAN|nr:hypothetical protein TanjilG_12280 [Lupinus angustifolius]